MQRTDEANGPIQWKMTHKPRLCAATADKYADKQACREWVCDGCARNPPQAAKVHFFVDHRFVGLGWHTTERSC